MVYLMNYIVYTNHVLYASLAAQKKCTTQGRSSESVFIVVSPDLLQCWLENWHVHVLLFHSIIHVGNLEKHLYLLDARFFIHIHVIGSMIYQRNNNWQGESYWIFLKLQNIKVNKYTIIAHSNVNEKNCQHFLYKYL